MVFGVEFSIRTQHPHSCLSSRGILHRPFGSTRRRGRVGGHRFDDRVAEVLGAEYPLGSALVECTRLWAAVECALWNCVWRAPGRDYLTYSINGSVIARVP